MKLPNPIGLLVCLFCLAGYSLCVAQDAAISPLAQLRLEQLTDKDGLSNTFITCFYHDNLGFMWFGSAGGIMRYDGYEVKTWVPEKDNTNSLSNHSVWAITGTSDGMIWVGTNNGLNRFDPKTESFKQFHFDPENAQTINNNAIVALHEDRYGNLWIGTLNGLCRLNKGKTTFERLYFDSKSFQEHSHVREFFSDESGSVWFGYLDSLYCFVPGQETFFSYPLPRSPDLDQQPIKTLFQKDKTHIWVSTSNNGIHIFDKKNKRFVGQIVSRSNEHNSLPKDYANSFLPDEKGNIWFGTYGSSLGMLSNDLQRVYELKPDPFNPVHINIDKIRRIFRDRAGNIWIGTFYGGAKIAKRYKKQFISYSPIPGKPGSIPAATIRHLSKQSGTNNIIVSQEGVGISLFDPEKETFAPYHAKSLEFDTKYVISAIERKNGDLWALTNTEIWLWNSKSKKWEQKTPQNSALEGDWFTFQYFDSRGRHWIGSQGGLFTYAHNSEQLIHQPIEASIDGGTGNNLYINEVTECKNGDIWVATQSSANRLKKEAKQFEFFPSDYRVLSIKEAPDGNIWMATAGGLVYWAPSTDNTIKWENRIKDMPGNTLQIDQQGKKWTTTNIGVHCHNPQTRQTRVYNKKDGLHDELFFPTSVQADNGEYYFAGKNSLLRFNPDSIKENPIIPPVVLTRFQILNQDVPLKGSKGDTLDWPSPLDHTITYTNKVVLRHWQNDFAFEFAALDFTAPLNNKYKYKLEGYNNDWVETGADRRFAHFTNISPGTYTFRVIASNNDGLWNEDGVSITIVVQSPWWATWWAFTLYILAIAGVIYTIYRFQLQRRLEHAEKMRLEELDAFKTRLYTNITHEFRTPLTIIIGLAGQLKSQASEGVKRGLDIISRNGKQTLLLVNQMLDLAKLDSGNLKLDPIQDDVVGFVKYIKESFHSLAQSKQIRLEFSSSQDRVIMDFDQEGLQSIVYNLLSNAIKFTQAGGAVAVEIEQANRPNGKALTITVRDNGPGIPEDKLPHVFDRFYQTDNATTRTSEGTGIGLALARELSRLMGGDIFVQSEEGQGASFTVTLPVTAIAPKQVADVSAGPPVIVSKESEGPIAQGTKKPHEGQPHLLIIEDNADVVNYLRSLLEDRYQLRVANDGQQGIETAIEFIPDLIISDVMMPKKDGFEVCQVLKSDQRTSHIPIILLTAKADMDSRLIGLRGGADSYLAKPFNKEELLVSIQNLLENRKKLQAHFLALGGSSQVAASEHSALEMEHAFIRRVRETIEADFQKQWTVPDIAAALFISQSQLYRKLEALTGMHTTAFIRYVRLQKATQLLLEHQEENISSIARDVGFYNIPEFNRRFKALFGMTPGQWREQKR